MIELNPPWVLLTGRGGATLESGFLAPIPGGEGLG